MEIIKLKTESQTVNRKPHRKITKLKSTLPFPRLAQTGTEQPGQGATLLGWPKSIYCISIIQTSFFISTMTHPTIKRKPINAYYLF